MYEGYTGYYQTPYKQTKASNVPRQPVYRSSYLGATPYQMSYFALPQAYGQQQRGAQVNPTLQDLPLSPIKNPSAAGGHTVDDSEAPIPAQTPQGAPIPQVVDAPPVAPGAPDDEDTPFPDINLDPLLLGTRAQIAGQRKQLAESDLAAFQQALLGFGSQDIARKVLQARAGEWQNKLGRSTDFDPFIASLSDNPDTSFSTLAQLKRRDQIRTDNTLETLGNLFYSGAGARRLDQAKYDAQNELAQGTNELYQALAGYGNEYNRGLSDLRDRESQAMEGAWNRSFMRWQDLKASKAARKAAGGGGGGGGGGGYVVPAAAANQITSPTALIRALESGQPTTYGGNPELHSATPPPPGWDAKSWAEVSPGQPSGIYSSDQGDYAWDPFQNKWVKINR